MPSAVFFEAQETFINTEGLIRKSNKLVFKKQTKTDWQLLRKFLISLNSIKSLGNVKDNKNIVNSANSFSDFRNFINFNYCATQDLTNFNFYLNVQNQKFSIYKNFSRFKPNSIKLLNTKTKYWLDDFYTNGKDKFCKNSLTLNRCSSNYKLQVTNFF
jgi:NADH dehydrogenase/NADH:ubiquinone oxidoreductase subunit G